MGAIALLSVLMLVAATRDVADLARRQQDQAAGEVASEAGAAYVAAGGWSGADLHTPVALARLGGGTVVVLDESGRSVNGASLPTKPQRLVRRDVVVDGRRVGTVLVAFSNAGLPGADRHLRNALVGTVAAGAGLAALLALGAAVVVSRRITRPVLALTETAQAVEAGNRTARVGKISAPGELGALAGAFDRMADSLDLQDSLRRMQVADVAHELRTPLTVLQATLEGMADGVVAATPDQIASVHDDVLRLIRIVEDLETLAAADAIGLILNPVPVDLAGVAASATAALGPQFEAANLVLETNLSSVMVSGDPNRLHQVVTNLLTNALKFTPAGGRVDVQTGHAGGAACLSVADSGPGIPPEELPHVFERFWRGAQARTVTGSGIGLTVVQRLVEAHAGKIRIESDPGRGTRVSVSLPSARVPGGGPRTPPYSWKT
jgi:two-component system sensor histidine kinase BaeS